MPELGFALSSEDHEPNELVRQPPAIVAQAAATVATDSGRGLERAHELWPNTALKWPLGHELATPSNFEAAAAMVEPGDLAESTPHGPDPEPYLEQIGRYEDAGLTHVFIHQIGSNQDEFAGFAAQELMPAL